MSFTIYPGDCLLRNDTSAPLLFEETQENLIDENTEISNTVDGNIKENDAMEVDNSMLNYLLQENLDNERWICRRHSLGGSSTISSPATRLLRRSSLQTPGRTRESTNDKLNRNLRNNITDIGSELFVNFLQEEINRSNLKTPESLQNCSTRISAQCGTEVDHEFLTLGTHLRLMADEFANSDHRREVRERAERISFGSLDSESFIDLLFALFQEGRVTWERILVLFVFCTDLALRALREHLLNCFNDVMNWSQIYIESWLTPWVQRHGGWAVVLERSVHEAYKAAVIGACIVGMLALWTYIRTNH